MPTFLGRRVPTSAIVASAPRPYTTPGASSPRVAQAPVGDLAKLVGGLGTTFANGTQTALRQEQLTKLADANELTRMVASSIGADGIVTNPQTASIAAALGAMDPTKYGRLQAIQAATTGGVDSPKAAEFLTGLGEYKSTPLYGERDFANKVALQGMQEATKLRMNDAQEATKLRLADSSLETVVTPEGPRLVRRSDAVGQSPVLSTDQVKAGVLGGLAPTLSVPEQKALTGVTPQSPELYVGTTASGTMPVTPKAGGGFANAQTGEVITEPLSSVGKLVATTNDGLKPTDEPNRALRDAQVSTVQALKSIESLKTELAKPNAGAAMGAVGGLAAGLNYIRAQTEAAAKALNPKSLGFKDEIGAEDVANTIDNAFRSNATLISKARELGIDHAVLRSQIQNLAYVIAKANDPGGRISGQDAQSAIEQIGGALGDPGAMSAVLDNLGQNLQRQYDAKDEVFRRTYGDKIAVPRIGGAAAAPAAGGSSLKQKYGLE
jgi:hypothetical protein